MRIGDVVTIIDIGCIYPTFQVMAEQLGADFDKWENNRMGGGSLAGSNAKILNINTDNINDDHILKALPVDLLYIITFSSTSNFIVYILLDF